jgi:hypothetical protein
MRAFSSKILGLLLGVSLIAGCGAGPNLSHLSKLSTQQMVSHEGNSTVALVYNNDDNTDSKVSDVRPICTAVWLDDTHILTAFHCAKGIQEDLQAKQDEKDKKAAVCEGFAALFHLCDPDGPVKHTVVGLQGMPMHYVTWKESEGMGHEPTGIHLSKLVGWDKDHDLALLEAQGRLIPAHENAKVAEAVPGMGEPIHACGHPKGLYWTFLEGTVAGYLESVPHDEKLGPALQVQVPIYFGNSGGGAFNEYGELVGIADFLMRVPSEGFYVPVVTIRQFLVAQNMLPAPAEVKKEDKKAGTGDVTPPSKDKESKEEDSSSKK